MIDSLGVFPNGVHGYASVGPHAVVVYLAAIALTIAFAAVGSCRKDRK